MVKSKSKHYLTPFDILEALFQEEHIKFVYSLDDTWRSHLPNNKSLQFEVTCDREKGTVKVSCENIDSGHLRDVRLKK